MAFHDRSRSSGVRVDRRNCLYRFASFASLGLFACNSGRARANDRRTGIIEHEVQSKYSHIRVRRLGNIRSMVFVRDNGVEAYQSQINLASPHLLRFNYLQHMFASYIVQPEQKKVLIVGLGGGSMVHFLQKHDPECEVDAVEIDPVVVQLAERFFLLKRTPQVRLIVADAFEYFAQNEIKYDVIYMDAFLKPSESTDRTGAPLQMRTLAFYEQLKSFLTDGGSVIFNINPHPSMTEDAATIAQAFPQTYVLKLPREEGFVVIGSTRKDRMKPEEFRSAARGLDRRFKAGFSFDSLASHLVTLQAIPR